MIVEIRMPEVAADMTEADVVGWLSAEGDPITQGDILFEIETDKSTVEIEAPATGVLTEIRVPAGQAGVAVGALLAIMEAAEEVGVEETEASRAADPEQAEPGPDVAQTAEITPQQAETRSEKPEATALARRIAQQAGLDIGEIQGSGARGRVLRADVDETLAEEPSRAKAEPETNEAPPHEAHASAPQPSADLIHLNTACRFDPLIRLTAQLNQGAEEPTLSWQVGLIRAIATAIRGTGFLRTDPGDEEVLPLSRLRVTDGSNSATALLVGAERMGLTSITAQLDSPQAETATNAGEVAVFHALQSGVDQIDAPLQANQICAFSIGAVRETPVVEDGELVAGRMVEINLCADPTQCPPEKATLLLGRVRQLLESPMQMTL